MIMITRGGIIPGGLLSEALDIRHLLTAAVDFPADMQLAKLLAWPKFIQFPEDNQLAGRRTLVVDDVWGSGRHIAAVKSRVEAAGGLPELCVMHFNPQRTLFSKLAPNYYGAITDAYIVYPWELDSRAGGRAGGDAALELSPRAVNSTVPADALAHARYLAQEIGPRGSATAAESRAADYACAEMRKLGLRDVRVEADSGQRSAWLPYAVIFGLALVGHLLCWALRPVALPLVYIPIAGLCFEVGAWWYYRTLTFDRTLLHLLLPKGLSQNVIGVVPAAVPTAGGAAIRRAVLVGHLDTHRTPWIFQGDLRTRLFPYLLSLGFWSLAFAPVFYGLAAILAWPPLAWLALATALTHLMGLVMSVQADFTPYTPGANDNAAAVGMPALARRLLAEPLARTQVWGWPPAARRAGWTASAIV